MATPITLILGDEELLVSRAVAALLGAARAADAEAAVRDLQGESIEADSLAELLSPSLFGGTTVLVIRAAQDLDESVRDLLGRYVADPMPDLILVIAQSGVVKGKKLLEALQSAGADVIRCARLSKPAERLTFVQNEIRSHGRTATAGACRALVETVGNDLRELAAAVAQIVADSDGGGGSSAVIDERLIARSHRGRAETTGFQIADAAVSGDAAGALSLLRQAMATGTPDLLVVSALAGALRDLANVRGAGSASPGAIAKTLGMPPWKVEKALRGARGWSDSGLAAALRAVADADLSVKGAGASSAFALERAVLRVADARVAA